MTSSRLNVAQQNLIQLLGERFPRHEFSVQCLKVLHKGRFANAMVYRYHDDQYDWVIKDFSHSPFWIRWSLGRLITAQETRAFDCLQGLKGVSPHHYALSPVTLAYDFIPGTPLRTLSQEDKQLPAHFFLQLERMVAALHRRGMVHLDLRNMGNILCGRDGEPYFIDFGSAIRYRRFPRWARQFMRGADLTGVYKGWRSLGRDSFPDSRQAFLKRYNQVRKRWIFRGYPLRRLSAYLNLILAPLLSHQILLSILEKLV
ncbi:serine/threonine protein kinase [Terasakiispira papahanaumokuakeensis]|uniref:non-specific serine/threonine protein kinase n=1 Tax=Terasakiispira papahanaumokuakeensis TaxID=197479 RepID=A0A1E2V662_9GAMM|nr:RIO1 family regulatory kinase/ATPase [Terasakiispira papahanaumokuakeensis]ODC02336.1 serine/threonine protein kinase [Terasakiispira papahanaumokuakeensis]